MELYILGLAGVLLHLLTKLLEARKSKLKLDWVLETIASLISVIIVIALVYAKEDLKAFYPISKVTAIILGYTAQSILRVLIKTVKPVEPKSLN